MKEIDIGKNTKVKLDDHRKNSNSRRMRNIEIEEMKGNMVYNKCYMYMECNAICLVFENYAKYLYCDNQE